MCVFAAEIESCPLKEKSFAGDYFGMKDKQTKNMQRNGVSMPKYISARKNGDKKSKRGPTNTHTSGFKVRYSHCSPFVQFVCHSLPAQQTIKDKARNDKTTKGNRIE